VYPAVFLIYFISAAVILLASLAVMVHFSILCNRAVRMCIVHFYFLLIFSSLLWSKHIAYQASYIHTVIHFVINVQFFFIRHKIAYAVKSTDLFHSFVVYYDYLLPGS
jgi:hypothetical protein